MNVSYHDQVITYTRNLIIQKGTYPVDKYVEFARFFSRINKLDNCKAILMKEI